MAVAGAKTDEADGLLRFMKTKRPWEELRVALAVIREFKSRENADEWAMPFFAWIRLEQLEDYLRLLTDEDAGDVRDETARAYFETSRR